MYERHLLASHVVDAVVSKEAARDYPLDRLNDMRAVINYAPAFARQCIQYQQGLLLLAKDPARMSGSRLFRIAAALLLAYGVAEALELAPHTGLAPLIKAMSREVALRLDSYPESDGISPGQDAVCWHPSDPEWSEATLLAATLAELADRLGMGEQNLYAHAPQIFHNTSAACIRRSFFVAHKTFAFPHVVTVVTHVEGGERYDNSVPIFRGRWMVPIPPEMKSGLAILIDGRGVSSSRELSLLSSTIGKLFISVCRREETLARRINLDVRKMVIYSAEFRYLARSNGRLWAMPGDGYRSVLDRKITNILGVIDGEGFANPMFNLIRLGVDRVDWG